MLKSEARRNYCNHSITLEHQLNNTVERFKDEAWTKQEMTDLQKM